MKIGPIDTTLYDSHPLQNSRHATNNRKNVWTSTTLLSGSWNTSTKYWTLTTLQGNSESTLTCSHVLLAVGGDGQISKLPTYPDLGLTPSPSQNHQLSAKVTLQRHCSPLSMFRKRIFLERKGQLAVHYFERFGGHYLDVRKSKKISEGMVRLHHFVL